MRNGVADDDQVTRWAREAGQGDRQAATAFIRALQHQLRRFVAHLVGPAEADDLTQEIYLRAMRALPGVRRPLDRAHVAAGHRPAGLRRPHPLRRYPPPRLAALDGLAAGRRGRVGRATTAAPASKPGSGRSPS